MIAVCYGKNDIVELLLRKGAKIDIRSKDGNTALVLASMAGNIEASEMLVAAGSDKNITGMVLYV
jgi:ankyrin repeat protein